MSKKRLGIILAAVLALTALAATSYQLLRAPSGSPGPGAAGKPGGGSPGGGPPGGFAVPVEVAPVERRSLADSASAVGTLRSNESVVLRPEASGRIVALPFREGRPVERGAVVVELDAAIQRAELMQARASLALAQSQARRAGELHGKAFVAESARDEADAALRAAEAAVALAEARLARMTVRAPFAGIVGIRNVSVGDFVKDGQELVNLEDSGRLKVDFRLPEAAATRLVVGMPVQVESDALPGRAFKAQVAAIDPQVDPAGRSIRVRAGLANPGALRPGMFVRVGLELGRREGVLMVPEEALVPFGSDQFVFRVEAQGEAAKAQRVRVLTGVRRDGRVEIRDGLAAGDRVVVAGQLKIRDGAPVRPLPAGGGSPPAGGAAAAPAGTGAAPAAKG